MFRIVVNIEKDKLLHFVFGLLITEIICAVMGLFHHLSYGGCVLALICSYVIVYLKEIYDDTHTGHSFEIEDILYGAVGSAIGMIIVMCVM